LFAPEAAAIDQLIAEHPFAQLISVDAGVPVCTPLPLLLDRGPDVSWLLGHFARSNPQVDMLRRSPRALAIFMGPHGYVSPSWMRDRTQAPTWNYATVHFEIEVAFDDSQAATTSALERLVAHMERNSHVPWTAAELGSRYAALSKAVIAFRAKVLATQAKFKLGQNERPDVFQDILRGLRSTTGATLADAMERRRRENTTSPSE
jgi:transcriptional regulator